MNMTIREVLKKMRLMLLLSIIVPVFIMILTGILWPNEIIYGIVFAVLVEIPLIVCYIVLKDIHKKKIIESEKYKKLEEYITTEMALEKKRRREKFIRESNKYTPFDTIYFGREKEFEKVDNSYKGETFKQNIVQYLEGMEANMFGRKLAVLIAKKGIDQYTLCKKAHLNRDILAYLNDPTYQIEKKDAIAFCIALKLNIDETLELLEQAGYSLDKLREYDCAICFFIENGLYEMEYINYEMYALGLPEF